MALEYRLFLSGDTPVDQVAERALRGSGERPVTASTLLTADLYHRYGFELTIRAGENAYVEVDTAEGTQQWTPAAYVSVLFRMEKSADPGWKVTNMLRVVRRLLDTGAEDAALVLNGDMLLLTRFGGVLVKHDREEWWDSTAESAFAD